MTIDNQQKLNLIIGLLATIVLLLAVYGLDRGIYLGFSAETRGGAFIKNCRYLFLSGISMMPAQGGTIDALPGWQYAEQPDHLFCRLFAQ